jgi:PPM family protein phosphatase
VGHSRNLTSMCGMLEWQAENSIGRRQALVGQKEFIISSVGSTDIGRVRATNQDSYLCDNKRGLFIVADGMGGHAGGEIASALAVINVRTYLDSKLVPYLAQPEVKIGAVAAIVAESINHASMRIYERALEEPNLKGMGTTATVARLVGNSLVIAHVGDSRLYLVRCGYIYQITTDHSLVSEQIRAGIITKEEAESHHLRNVITRSVGYQEQEDVDSFVLALEVDDLILLCSDGLHGRVSAETISSCCRKYGVLAVDQLISEANSSGGDDNISVVICQIKV